MQETGCLSSAHAGICAGLSDTCANNPLSTAAGVALTCLVAGQCDMRADPMLVPAHGAVATTQKRQDSHVCTLQQGGAC